MAAHQGNYQSASIEHRRNNLLAAAPAAAAAAAAAILPLLSTHSLLGHSDKQLDSSAAPNQQAVTESKSKSNLLVHGVDGLGEHTQFATVGCLCF